jgi:CRP/FNR family transcriptional activator FtrB
MDLPMRAADLPELRHLPLFRDMLEESFESLMSHAYAQVFPAGLELIRQGDPGDFLHVVVEGAVELYSTWADRQCTMAILHPVGVFILAACIKDAPCLMSARTIERSRIILIPASDMRATFRRDNEFAVSVITELAGAYRAVVRQTKGLKLRNSRERIASYFLQQSRQVENASSFTLLIEKRHLASYLGMTAENLSRALKSLEEEGVKVDGSRVIITDGPRLTRLAQPDLLLDGPDPEAPGLSLAHPAPG